MPLARLQTIVRTHAKSYARCKKYIEKFVKMHTQLQSLSLQMTVSGNALASGS
jgi:hypothetical protein